MLTLYSMQRSGNCYKVRLALSQLGTPYRLVEIDILKGETRTPDFLARNPSGHVPLLEASPGRFLPESGAILWYLAGGSDLAPDNRLDRAETLQWMFFEQHSVEPYLGAAHFWLGLVKGGRELQMHAVEEWMEHGYRAFSVMEKHLATHDFFAADRYTIADIALYGYTHIRALRLHAHRQRMRLRPHRLPGDPRLAQAYRRAARPRADGLASDRDGDRGVRHFTQKHVIARLDRAIQ
jgi:glutathione S-transferase